VLKLSSNGSDVLPKVLELSPEVSECKPLALGEGSEGRPLDDILGCATNPGTVVLLAAPLTGVREQVAEVCWKLCLGLVAFEPLSVAVRQRQGLTLFHFSAQF